MQIPAIRFLKSVQSIFTIDDEEECYFLVQAFVEKERISLKRIFHPVPVCFKPLMR